MAIFSLERLKTKWRTAQVPAWQGSLGSPSQIQSGHYSGQRGMSIRAAQKQTLAPLPPALANPVPASRHTGCTRQRAITKAFAFFYRQPAAGSSARQLLAALQRLQQPLQNAFFPQGVTGSFHQLEFGLRPVAGQFVRRGRRADHIMPALHDDGRQVTDARKLLQ